MLGVAKQVDGARDHTGKLTSVYYDMGNAIQQLARTIPIATNQLADMVTAGARMGIAEGMNPEQARKTLIEFTRVSAMAATAFEMPAGELADNMGKIAGIFKIPISDIERLGDAINYLDDNAISKGGDIIKVMQGDLAGAASTM
ncbi:phage tail tape measure protein, partial [Xylella fastidiosa subsp. multiplex]|nr:phage tail tape measure protein [Xylella fastidiosa subsp. multiplex]